METACSSRSHDSSRKKPPLRLSVDRTPVMQSFLFDHGNRTASSADVVPETPNNSYHQLAEDERTTVRTVLETPDTPLSILVEKKMDNAENVIPNFQDDTEMSEAAFEDKLVRCAPENPSEDEDEDFLNVTPELNLGKRRNLMSILESEHSFTQSLRSQRTKNSSMVASNRPTFSMPSPVKRRNKRKSLADIILPFDLNDDDLLSKKLQTIQENKEKSQTRSNTNRLSLGSGTKSAGATKNKGAVKSRMSLQFSDLNLQDVGAKDPNNRRNLLSPMRVQSPARTPNNRQNLARNLLSPMQVQSPVTAPNNRQNLARDVLSPMRVQSPARTPNNRQNLARDVLSPMRLESPARTPNNRRNLVRDVLSPMRVQPQARTLMNRRNLVKDVISPMRVQSLSRTPNNRQALVTDMHNAKHPPAGTQDKGKESEGNTTQIFESEDLELTAVNNVNQSVANLVMELESQNQQVVGRDGAHSSSRPTSRRKPHEQEGERIPSVKDVQVSGDSSISSGGSSISSGGTHMAPTQPASILVLQGVVAYVEVRLGNGNSSEVFKDQLRMLGATVKEKLTSDVTHVVFKDGNMGTFKRAKKRGLHLVSCLWVEACRENSIRVSEALYPSSSIELYSNPLATVKLKNMKPTQPKDFEEEVRIATMRAERRKKMRKNVPSVTSVEEDQCFTPPRTTTTSVQNVNSPLFGIEHLLTPSRQNADTSATQSETASEDSVLNASYGTPLSKRLYNKFCNRQQEEDGSKENDSSKTSSQLDSEFVTASENSSNSSSGLVNAEPVSESNCLNLDKDQPSRGQGGNSNELQNRNGLHVHRIPATAGTSEEASREPRLARVHQTSKKPYTPRRSQRLSLMPSNIKNVDTSHENESRTSSSSVASISAENFSSKATGKIPSSNDKGCQQGSLRLSTSSDESKGDSPEQANANVTLRGRHRITPRKQQKAEIRHIKKIPLKEKRKSYYRQTKNCIAAQDPTTSSSSAANNCPKEGSRGTQAAELSGSCPSGAAMDEVASCSSVSFKSKGRKLHSTDCIEPSQDLIVPTTPQNSQTTSHDPYADLQIKKCMSQRVSLKNLQARERRRTGVSRKGKSNSFGLRRGRGSRSSSSGRSDLDNVFTSSDEEHSTFQIFPLPRTRKSIDDFVVRKPRRGTKGSVAFSSSICLTSFHSKEKKCIIPIIRKLGKFDVTCMVDGSTSHIVCGEERRTLNALFGIARGIWVVDKSWLYESLEMEQWAPEEPFEIFTFFPAAKICREQREVQGKSYKQTLFSGVGNVYVMEGCIPPTDQLKELMVLCGCNVVANHRNANIVVCNPSTYSSTKTKVQVTHVSEKWVLDCIQQHKILNIDDYKISENLPPGSAQRTSSTTSNMSCAM